MKDSGVRQVAVQLMSLPSQHLFSLAKAEEGAVEADDEYDSKSLPPVWCNMLTMRLRLTKAGEGAFEAGDGQDRESLPHGRCNFFSRMN